MEIVTLHDSHVEDAAKLVYANYLKERKSVGILPLHDDYMQLFIKLIGDLLNKGIGVAALNNGRLAGFMSGFAINAFKSLNRGVYCPIYGNAAVEDDKRLIYQRMYEKIAGMWVDNGCLTHALTVFAHDKEAIDTWFWNGFGLRCVDAIRPAESVPVEMKSYRFSGQSDISVRRVQADDADAIFPLYQDHAKYYSRSPLFMCVFRLPEKKEMIDWLNAENNAMWAAFEGDRPLAFMKVGPEGETFVGDDTETRNICGAYVDERYRSTGVGTLILSHISDWLANNGFKRLGVDYESFNIYGSRFWMKHFEPFTFSLIRRIDERILWANANRTERIMF